MAKKEKKTKVISETPEELWLYKNLENVYLGYPTDYVRMVRGVHMLKSGCIRKIEVEKLRNYAEEELKHSEYAGRYRKSMQEIIEYLDLYAEDYDCLEFKKDWE